MKKGIQENLNGNGLSIGIDTKWYSLLGEREVSRTLVIENIKKYQNTGGLKNVRIDRRTNSGSRKKKQVY